MSFESTMAEAREAWQIDDHSKINEAYYLKLIDLYTQALELAPGWQEQYDVSKSLGLHLSKLIGLYIKENKEEKAIHHLKLLLKVEDGSSILFQTLMNYFAKISSLQGEILSTIHYLTAYKQDLFDFGADSRYWAVYSGDWRRFGVLLKKHGFDIEEKNANEITELAEEDEESIPQLDAGFWNSFFVKPFDIHKKPSELL